jgi:capsule polysaccharide export protein KpsE/RkpR
MLIHGGKRSGAGRPKGSVANHTIEASEARKFFVQKIIEDSEPIIDTLVEAAKNGNVKIAQYLIDQVADKPKETEESFENPVETAFHEIIQQNYLDSTAEFGMKQLQERN